jgi:hypothetical protein
MAKFIARFRGWAFHSISVVSLVLFLAMVTVRVRGGVSGFTCWARPGGNLYIVQSQSDRVIFGVASPWPCSEHRWNTAVYPVQSETDWGGDPVEVPWHHHPLGVDTLSSEGLVAVDPDGRVPWTLGGRSGGAQPTIPVRFWTLVLPSRLLLAVLSPLPAVWIGTMIRRFRLYRRRRLNDRTHCHTCGYDLTGNVSGVCPECGRSSSEAV